MHLGCFQMRHGPAIAHLFLTIVLVHGLGLPSVPSAEIRSQNIDCMEETQNFSQVNHDFGSLCLVVRMIWTFGPT